MAEPTPTARRTPRIDPAALQRHLRQSASRAAPWLHEEIARRMAERLSLVRRQPARVIDWWSPTSGSAALLKAQYPQARLLPYGCDDQPLPEAPGTDTGPRWWQRLIGQPARAELPAAPPTAELLWANMMLHWVDDLPALLPRWHAALEVDGFLMFSCFGPDTLLELRAVYAELGWGLPGSPWIDMHDLGDELVHAGFADPVMDMEYLTLTWDSPAALLAELRGLGRNTASSRQPGLRGRQWRQTLDDALKRHLTGPDGRLHLRFEIIYGHAFRPVTRARVQAQTEISLDAMREMTRQRNPGRTD
ncbi:biotin synthase [uncultured Sphaerotilus sp.]|uniref:biotin synthase n=1 Tax=uncultured Sphaerotilus sp. TaxID=474984 RepID=UPI0030CA2879